ncbi:MAG: hypothetical protein VZR09_11285 [Candidatus Gastranaerophilaceae bacterium]|nr:hypothetical protein [Candidatus Gastranaerophilaceae bacterium]
MENQGYFIKSNEAISNGNTYIRSTNGTKSTYDIDKKVELAKERLLRGETIKSTDADFQMEALEPIQDALREQGLNVVYTLPTRSEPYKQLKLFNK